MLVISVLVRKNMLLLNHKSKKISSNKIPLPSQILHFSIYAFTLLEMLVVIGIIAVLISMAVASYSTAQRKARDAKRKADLKAFQNAMEQCYSVNSYSYPNITGGGTTSISEDCPSANGPDLTITDPTNKTYSVTSSSTAYTVTINLEDGTNFSISNQQ